MSVPLSGTVTFLFTDIEGSTRLLQKLGDHYADLLPAYKALLRSVFEAHHGREIDTQGDAFFVAFARARDAVAAAVTAQRKILDHVWPGDGKLAVRMGVHTGEPLSVGDGYIGIDVHKTARICNVAHGGQILLSQTTRELVAPDLPGGLILRDLAEHRLKDLAAPMRIFQVVAAGLPDSFPPLRSLDALPNNLSRQLTSFVGREREISAVKGLLQNAYLLTLTGVGGCGKTRLALQVGADLLEEYADGVWLVELGSVTDPALVSTAIASLFGLASAPALTREEVPARRHFGAEVVRSSEAILADYLQPKEILLILDNCGR